MKKKQSNDPNMMIFMGMGFELLSITIGALYVGDIIDKHFGWPGYGVAGLTILVMIGWFVHLGVLLRRFMDD